jgi:replication factor A1
MVATESFQSNIRRQRRKMSSDASPVTKIVDLRPNMKSVGPLTVIVLERGVPSQTKDRHRVSRSIIADDSGSVVLSLWDDQVDLVQPGDILKLNGYTALFKDSLTIYTGQHGSMSKIGE